jgi:hypothetical protein
MQLETKQHNVTSYVYVEVAPINKQAMNPTLTEE